jgi:D-amino-acid oxidase
VTERATDVLVLGAGVIGLTTAVCLAEDGLAVTIRTGHLPAQTTSAVAGAIWGPHLVEDSDRVRRWCAETLDVLASLAGQPAAGIQLVSGTEAARSPAARPGGAGPLAALGALSPAPPGALPPGFVAGWRYTAPVVCMPVYLDYLLGRFRRAGGGVQVSPVRTLGQAAAETGAPVIVNCTGSGAHDLVPDPSLSPVRGQVVIVENPGITEFFIGLPDSGHEISYLFPHAGRVVLGGTEVSGDWSTEPRPATAQRILRDCAAIEPRLDGARILEHRCGLRPVRPQVRLEAGPAGSAPGPAPRVLVHNYGHGGAGVTLSWGCAREAARLARQAA